MTAPAMPMARPLPRSASRGAPRKTAVAKPDLAIHLLSLAAVFGIWRLQEIIPGAGPLKLPVLTLVAAIVVFFATRPVAMINKALGHIAMRCVMGLALLAVIGGPLALVRGYTLTFVVFDLAPTLLLCLFVAAAIRSESDARWILSAITVGGVIFCLYSRTHSFRDSAGRPTGIIFYDANDLALLASTTAVVALGLAHTARLKSHRLLWLGSAAVLLQAVLWTVSRGAFIAVLVSAAYLFFSPIMPAARRSLVLGLGFVALLAVGGKSYLNTMSTILNPKNDYNFSGKSANGRGEVWKRGLGYVWARPIMGAGARNYTAAENRSDYAKARMQNNQGFKLSRAHNSYLEIAVELGIPGFLLFAIALLETVRRLHTSSRFGEREMNDSRRMNAYMASAFAGFIVGAFFLSAEYWTLVYGLIGVAVALTLIERDRRSAAGRAKQGQLGRRPIGAPVGPTVRSGGSAAAFVR